VYETLHETCIEAGLTNALQFWYVVEDAGGPNQTVEGLSYWPVLGH
jgi:hypothetical protein